MTAKELLTEHKLEATYWGLKIIEWEDTGERPEMALSLAGDWATCACGKQDPRIPRWNGLTFDMDSGIKPMEGTPKDTTLRELGNTFGEIWEHKDSAWAFNAAKCLVGIEDRAAQITAEFK